MRHKFDWALLVVENFDAKLKYKLSFDTLGKFYEKTT